MKFSVKFYQGGKRFMKKFAVIMFALLLAVSMFLASCSSKTGQESSSSGNDGGTENSAESSGGNDGGPVELVWWVHENPSFVDANKQMIAAYQADHPNVKINLQVFPYDAFVQKIRVSMNTGQAPDIVQMFGTWVREYAKNGLLEPAPNGDQLKDQVFPAAIGGFEYEGRIYGVPHEFNIENGGVLRHPKMFEEAGIKSNPQTWSELIEAAKQLTKRKGDQITVRGLDVTSVDSTVFYFLALIQQQGADFWNEDQTRVNFSTPEAKKAMQELVDLIQVHKVSDLTKVGTTEEPYMTFFKGGSAMTAAGPWTIAEGLNTFHVNDFDYMPVPSYTDKPPVFSAESGWGEVISSQSRHKEAAWDFLQFMMQDENAYAWNIRTSTIPAQKAVAQNPKYLEDNPYVKASLDVLEYGRWIGPLADRDFFFTTVHDAFVKIASGRGSLEQGLKEAEDAINKMLEEKQ
jgi:multiple sugar transport system substrate-binding protein